jgi:uncharacterized protein YaaR (DUF327 family)
VFVDDWGEGMGLKIDGSGQSSSGRMNKTVTGNIHVAGRNQSNFNSQLKKQTSQHLDETLKQMAQEIFKQGEQLSEKVDISQLKAYKRLISEFLNESVRGFAKFSRESFLDRRGRHRLYATVKKVNENLEELTKEILKKEQDHLKIVGRIEDIRGLILDIIL